MFPEKGKQVTAHYYGGCILMRPTWRTGPYLPPSSIMCITSCSFLLSTFGTWHEYGDLATCSEAPLQTDWKKRSSLSTAVMVMSVHHKRMRAKGNFFNSHVAGGNSQQVNFYSGKDGHFSSNALRNVDIFQHRTFARKNGPHSKHQIYTTEAYKTPVEMSLWHSV